jgi:CspA family cold shock protein
MNLRDKLLNCSECGTEFVFRVEEQRRMAAEGEIVEPQTCASCQANRGQDRRLVGRVKWFDRAKGYGFIQRDDGRGEVFVHRNDIQHGGIKVLYEGENVEFDLECDPRGEKAVKVTGHDPFAP